MLQLTDMQKIGLGLTGFGVFFFFMGVILLLDRSLLAMGNVLFISGLTMLIGVTSTYRFFFQAHKIKSSTLFFLGIFLVLLGYTLTGMILEGYGFFTLFRGFIPTVINFLRRLPVISAIFLIPGLGQILDRLGGNLPV